MPSFCLIVGCGNKSDCCGDLSFCRVPKVITNQGEEIEQLSIERRRLWLAAISRDDLSENILENDRVCGKHFVSGKAANLWDRFNPDWIPSLYLGHSKRAKQSEKFSANLERSERLGERRKRKAEREKQENERAKALKLEEASELVRKQDVVPEEFEDVADIANGMKELTITRDVGTSTDDYSYLYERPREQGRVYDEDYFSGDDDKVKFYTGLPTFEILKKTFDFIAPHSTRRSPQTALNKFQEFIMVLIKLRLNVPHQDLAYRFGVSRFLVSRIFNSWIVLMDIRLSPLIVWPDRKDLHKTMPRCFMDAFRLKTTVIIDCFEIFIDRPSNLLARAQTFSNYKHHNTVKVLIGIAPQGAISFVSEAWGGRTSDKCITENSGILKNLLPGDLVLADRGFTINEDVLYYQAALNIPAFTKGKSQLHPTDVEKTRNIATVRIHVERVIGVLRQKYTFLQSILPTDYLCTSKLEGKETPLIDRIIRVCSALVNLCPPIIPFD